MQTLIKFKSFVDELQQDNGRNYKLSILEKYKDDEDIQYYLHFIFNPYITTGISDKKLYKDLNVLFADPLIQTNSVKELLEFIKTHNTGSDKVIETIQYFKDEILDVDLYELFDAIITKNVILGISVLSINKIIPDLIPTFDVQLANKYFDNPTVVEGKEFALTTKIDGGRIVAIKKNGVAKFYTRQGQEYEGLVDLKEEMEKYMPDNTCLDGEITLLNPYVPALDGVEGSTKLSSKDQYKQTMKITRKDGEKHGVKMLVFDCMTADEFENQKSCNPYYKRRELLDSIFNEYNFKYFEPLPILYRGKDTLEITKWLNYNIDNGEEGIMINMVDALYDFKRTDNLLKVKKMQDVDLPIIGYEEGTNSNKGKLGAFIVNYKGNNVKVGSGFTKELREEIWKHPDDYIGLTISVQYFEETCNANGGISLRFPVFLDFRYDK